MGALFQAGRVCGQSWQPAVGGAADEVVYASSKEFREQKLPHQGHGFFTSSPEWAEQAIEQGSIVFFEHLGKHSNRGHMALEG